MDPATQLYLAKALHIIFVVAWFAGLFYMPRLFIYQCEARQQEGAPYLIAQFKLMSTRLWYIITWPACVLATLFALWMLWLVPSYLHQPWMQLKLALVVALLLYHGSLQWLYTAIQRDVYPMSSTQLRLYNEVATLLLFAIVFTVVFKDLRSWSYGVFGLLGLGVLLSAGVVVYKRLRSR
jgi:putative membrane protein